MRTPSTPPHPYVPPILPRRPHRIAFVHRTDVGDTPVVTLTRTLPFGGVVVRLYGPQGRQTPVKAPVARPGLPKVPLAFLVPEAPQAAEMDPTV
jgi:hypothetical protein